MTIDQVAIEKRLAQLEQDRKQLMADFNALEGAMQDCRFWLAHLKQEAEKESG